MKGGSIKLTQDFHKKAAVYEIQRHNGYESAAFMILLRIVWVHVRAFLSKIP